MTTISEHKTVLGIDLASSNWNNNGRALVTFTTGPDRCWNDVSCQELQWPNQELNAANMAEHILKLVDTCDLAAVSLDGPQGWREPNAGDRPGVGRWCEYLTRCQGKTGVHGKCYPQTQSNWIRFCIELFEKLMLDSRAVVPVDSKATVKPGQFLLLECFPTFTWKSSDLQPLPGKSKVGRNQKLVGDYARSIVDCYQLPIDKWFGSHDDLQALVATLPAVGLLGGPAKTEAYGKPGYWQGASSETPRHWVEGLIWDAKPAETTTGKNAV